MSIMANINLKTSTKSVPQCLQKQYTRSVQNYLVVWCDSNINEDESNFRNSITKLREVSNTVHTFTRTDQCIDFINEVKTRKIFLISSGALSRTLIPIVHEFSQIKTIYIFCENQQQHEQWAKQWFKVKDVFTNVELICKILKKDAQTCDENAIPMSFVPRSNNAKSRKLNELNQSFMYTQILKEILLTIDFKQEHFVEFITYCREQFNGNPAELLNVNMLDKEYHQHTAIWWYTYECFLYSMLNCALRSTEVNLIVKLGFFIRNLHEQIARLHTEQYPKDRCSESFVVYRGQSLSRIDFDQLKQSIGGLLSFNSFLSTSKIRTVSLEFVGKTLDDGQSVGILFKMTIDPSIQSTPFANISNLACYVNEKEILFSMHSIFRIERIAQMNEHDGLWQVDLTLTGDHDIQLWELTEHIRTETFPEEKGWYRLGALLIKLGRFDEAEQVYDMLFNQTTREDERANIYQQLGWLKDRQGKYKEAITFNQKTLEIREKTLPPDHPSFSTPYNNLGLIYNKIGEYSKALSLHHQALAIEEKVTPTNHSSLAATYCNIGRVYMNMEEYSQSLVFQTKALEIRQKILPSNHPRLAASYSNIAVLHEYTGDYEQSLCFHRKALDIFEKVLLPDHPDLASSYCNIGRLYSDLYEHTQALSFQQKALAIREKKLDSNHPDLATSYCNIGTVYEHMDEYPQALLSHHQALAIRETIFSPNHHSLILSCNNLGRVYDKMDDHLQAHIFYQRALNGNEHS